MEMEAKLKYLEENIAQEERRMQEMDAETQRPSQGQGSRSKLNRLIVTGLNWRMPREEVYQQFSTFGELVSCELPLHADGRPVGKALLEYADEESAQRAMLKNGDIFGPGILSIQYDDGSTSRPSARTTTPTSNNAGGPRQTSNVAGSNDHIPPYTKIQIRGLPWRAQKQDLIDYFSVFGPINSCKLDVQGDGRSSGGAAIEFRDAESAARAMQMNGREYYGDARLSIQYLSPSGTPVDMRIKPQPKPSTTSEADEDNAWYN
jgi:RNA recognition motif-containing protein